MVEQYCYCFFYRPVPAVTMRKTSTYQLYDVPIIASDLRHEELIHQIADSLDYLDNVMDDVFSRVQSRVSENKTRLAKINDRTRLAHAKVNHIRGRKKATQVDDYDLTSTTWLFF